MVYVPPAKSTMCPTAPSAFQFVGAKGRDTHVDSYRCHPTRKIEIQARSAKTNKGAVRHAGSFSVNKSPNTPQGSATFD